MYPAISNFESFPSAVLLNGSVVKYLLNMKKEYKFGNIIYQERKEKKKNRNIVQNKILKKINYLLFFSYNFCIFFFSPILTLFVTSNSNKHDNNE